ncbi:glycosyltransferase family 4 protein [Granulicella sp. WH15]|uniref:glycosyltransferase family 4 protein n=1 Tax=Granulicella sp. WH15 TaxID=2602070 RepID=UPI001366BE49|nr:glycosyltransferase family 4 protein [Granulicella sp. WH15]QHN04092.1 glycosyltransferase family 4 protein [Granulicella sp. WH15]
MGVNEAGVSQVQSRTRLAIVVSHPIQHFCPMYRDIAADGRVDLLVIFAEAGAAPKFDPGFGKVIHWQADLLEGFNHTVLSDAKPEERPKAVLAELKRFSPDVVYVHGYALPYLRATMRWAKGAGIPVLMTTDSELLHPRPWYIEAVKRVVLPWTLKSVDLFLTVGDENERYFAHYGVDRERFHRVSFSIDSKYYEKTLVRRDEARREVRERLGIPTDAMVVLTVGKMIPRKEQADLVRAFLALEKSGYRSAVLLIAGDGALRPQMEELAKPLGEAVKMPGFVGVDQLPEFYVASDVYAHPSTYDPHPLAISEALYCSLPVVASDQIGSVGATDDVQAGRNGWVYKTGDIGELTTILARLIDQPEMRRNAGKESKQLGNLHASDYCAKKFVDGALLALSRKRR